MAATGTTTVILLLLTIITTTSAAAISTGFIKPNFTASNFQYIDTSGDFLRSPNHTYTAAIFNPQSSSSSSFYLVIYHTNSHIVVWTGNRNTPISSSGEFHLSLTGITVNDDSGRLVWSTPILNSTVDSLHLLDSGNLVILDRFNYMLWQSFDYPTDTVVSQQRFRVGQSLISSTSLSDLSAGDYSFTVTSGDGILQWRNITYYKLLMDPQIFKNSNRPVSYVTVNGSGFYFLGVGDPGPEVVIQVLIDNPPGNVNSSYRILKITNEGYLAVMRYKNRKWVKDFSTPAEACRNPYRCGKLGLCSDTGCSCPLGFRIDSKTNLGCTFSDPMLLWPSPESCSRQGNSLENYTYVQLGDGINYFELEYLNPVKTGLSLSNCEDLCSGNCNCLGYFYGNQSGSCYLIENNLGSIISSSNNDRDVKLGFIKAVVPSPLSPPQGGNLNSNFPLFGLLIIPISGVLLIMICAIFMNKRSQNAHQMRMISKKLVDNSFSDELEMFTIAGLPVRFTYKDIVLATANFNTRIGSGGFGTVYKGVLRDKSVVAVKKITALGSQGKKEFGTEIAIIGNVHHVNLVKLRGFCSFGREKFLVYEYMSRGSLDRTIFGSGMPLEWQERFEIAVGVARGLAYLHNGCEHKIIHCDVKPENILLNESMQVKISDFGLSKLLSPEQSGLFTNMRGTRGYLAPEWLTNAAISDKTDVYSYGMVLLELIHGEKNYVQARTHVPGSPNPCSGTEERSSGSSDLQARTNTHAYYFPLHALEMHEAGRYLDLVDHKLTGRVTIEEAEKLVKVALCCLHEDPLLRPTMANVVAMLEGTLSVVEPQLELLNFLRFYGRRVTEPSNAETVVESELESGFMVPNIDSCSTSVSLNSFSYMSSQQISGPR
ncbi:G-type lectin S-receptor-like serine/threonine-protein kinase At5g35370 [Rutidosis leptorrhynchoides]|uniref:G-type lectin S-receptor-like serine/threonine-protein kinase At5g35370 n=1 Tax=Rutidosis leptorrhynchoides TaxID=125765 RepID=UPI003A99E8B7